MTGTYRSRCAAASVRTAGSIAARVADWPTARAGTVAVLLVLSLVASARIRAETTAPADDSQEAQQDALQALPLDQINEEARARLTDVVMRPTIYRRLPTETVACDADMYLTLVRNPDIIVSIWRKMRLTEVTMQRTRPFHYDCDDKAGTISQIELIYGTPHLHVYYADSLYEGPLMARPVKARVVLLLRTEFAKNGQTPVATSRMDAFIRIDHLAANIVARTFTPLVGRTADHNFTESLRFIGHVNETAEENGPGMQRLAMRLEEIDQATREKFATVSGVVAQRAQERNQADFVQAAPAEGAEPEASEGRVVPRTTQWRR